MGICTVFPCCKGDLRSDVRVLRHLVHGPAACFAFAADLVPLPDEIIAADCAADECSKAAGGSVACEAQQGFHAFELALMEFRGRRRRKRRWALEVIRECRHRFVLMFNCFRVSSAGSLRVCGTNGFIAGYLSH